ncbi:MAG: restriction endonuclease subunit S [Bacteroidales bacterium]|nr:restriction endonuclease subunit S [Bacteroidales bacterium]
METATKKILSGYKSSPLGIIPEDWKVKRIGEFAPLQRGFDLPTDKIIKGNYPVVYSNGILNYHHEYKVKGPGVVTGRSGTIGKVTYVESDYWPHNTSLWVTDFKNNDPRYVFHLYKYLDLSKFASGSGVPTLNRNDVHSYKIAVPPIHVQQRIVSVLSLWDTAIEKQTALIEQLTLRKLGLMQQLLTGKKRLKGFEGEWKRIKAGEIFKSISVKGNGSEVLLSATQEHGVIPRDQLEGRVTMPTGDTNSFKLVEVGDFVISLRSFQGGLEYSEHRGIVSPAYTVLKPIVEIDKPFYRYYFKSAEFIGHLAIAVIGIRDGKQISYEDFCFVKIPYPNIEEQKAISAVLLQADKEIEIQKPKLAAMQEQKKGLMQVLLTGKKRINK